MDKRRWSTGDLTEKIKGGELKYKSPAWSYMGSIIWWFLCFIPAIAKLSGLEALTFFAELSAIEFPSTITYLSIAIFVTAVFLVAWSTYSRIKEGGLHSEDDTVRLLRNGSYRIVRHPSDLALTIFYVTSPIFLSKYAPFTVLSAIGFIVAITSSYYASIQEEKLNLRKWVDEYRQYMNEVPRWNIILGIWRWIKNR